MFRITAEGAKIHWTNMSEVAFNVAEDLKKRFDMVKIEMIPLEQKEDEFIFDLGGILVNSDIKFWRLSDGLAIGCREHHMVIFNEVIKEEFTTKKYVQYGSKFFKIHGNMHVLCLSPQQKEEFYRFFRKTVIEKEKNKLLYFKGNI